MGQDNVPAKAVVAAAKKRQAIEGDKIYTLTTGVRVRFRGVGWGLLVDIAAQIPDPPVPVWQDPERPDKPPVENPNDPAYQQAILEVAQEREWAQMDGFAMFGIELVDGVPPDEEWLPRLKFLAKRGRLSLEGVDLDDEMEREWTYKRYIATSLADYKAISEYSRAGRISQEGIRLAEDSFPGNEESSTDS